MRRYGPLAIVMAVIPLLAFGPSERTAPTHWAFIVGISDYINFEDAAGGDLPGAERDARVVRDVLVERWGFPVDNVRMLLNQDATRDAIEEGLTEWLPNVARPQDQITVFFAGHGSQMWDESGDEDDGLDETIAPADVSPETTEFDIGDDEFGEWLAALPSSNVLVILDNCNSGTGTRDVTPFARTRELGRDVNDVTKPPTVSRRALAGQEDETGFDASGGRVLELAAAQPFQAAVDAYFPGEGQEEGFHGGAFTTFLVRELWRAPSSATYEEVFDNVRQALKRNRFEQDPHLSEDVPQKSSPLFFVEGGASAEAHPFLPVLSVRGEQVELGGGRALGITSGSIFELESGARLVTESVTADRIQGRLLSGEAREGMKARLTGYRFPTTTLTVNVAGVDTETATAVKEALEGVTGIAIEEDEQAFSHLLLRRRGSEVRVVGMDGATRHAFPIGRGGAADVAAALRQEAAAKRLADMENPSPSFGIKVWMADNKTSFGIGEAVTFNAVADRDGYLTLVDLGTDGTVTVLFPKPFDRDNRVTQGQEIVFPTATMESEIRAMPPSGRGMVRAFLTPHPLDLPVGDEFTSGDVLLADQIAQAIMTAAGFVPGVSQVVILETWASASVVYDIRP